MADSDKFYIGKVGEGQNIKATDLEPVEGFSGKNFGDKLQFTVGFSYIMGGAFGVGKGLFSYDKRIEKMPKKLVLNYKVNSVITNLVKYGNACGAASMIL